MVKKIRTCDVCRKKIDDHGTRYKLLRRWPTLFDERIDVDDMCDGCYWDFIKFVNQKRSNNNDT